MILILARRKLTYYEEIKDQLHDTNKDDISKADGISVEVDDFKEANEAFENQVEVCIDDKVKTDSDEFED
jgi:nicotinate-nucleotide pyrophosphorylase